MRLTEMEISLSADAGRYTEIVTKGRDALSTWDRSDWLGLETALFLTHNHVSYDKAIIRAIKGALGMRQVA
jgi:hypothetical protein